MAITDVLLFANNKSAVPAVNFNSGDLGIVLSAGQGAGFPTPASGQYFVVTVQNLTTGAFEICHCTNRTGDILTVTRAQEGTLAQNFTVGNAVVQMRATKGMLEKLLQVRFSGASVGQFLQVQADGTVLPAVVTGGGGGGGSSYPLNIDPGGGGFMQLRYDGTVFTWENLDSFGFPGNDYPIFTIEETGTTPIVDFKSNPTVNGIELVPFDLETTYDPRTSMRIVEDFLFVPNNTAANGWDINVSGAGASITGRVGEAGHPGIIRIDTGTTTLGTAAAQYILDASAAPTTGITTAGGGVVAFDAVFRHPGTIPSTAQMAYSRLGVADDIIGVPANGIYFTCADVAGVIKIVGACRAAGVTSSTSGASGVNIVSGQWYQARWVMNAAGTSVEFFVDNVSIGTVATNIPASTVALSPFVEYDKDTGVTSLSLDIDVIQLRQIFTTPRWIAY